MITDMITILKIILINILKKNCFVWHIIIYYTFIYYIKK